MLLLQKPQRNPDLLDLSWRVRRCYRPGSRIQHKELKFLRAADFLALNPSLHDLLVRLGENLHHFMCALVDFNREQVDPVFGQNLDVVLRDALFGVPIGVAVVAIVVFFPVARRVGDQNGVPGLGHPVELAGLFEGAGDVFWLVSASAGGLFGDKVDCNVDVRVELKDRVFVEVVRVAVVLVADEANSDCDVLELQLDLGDDVLQLLFAGLDPGAHASCGVHYNQQVQRGFGLFLDL